MTPIACKGSTTQAAFRFPNKPNKDDFATELAERTGDVASFSTGLTANSAAALDCCGPETVNFENPVHSKVGTNHQQHAGILRYFFFRTCSKKSTTRWSFLLLSERMACCRTVCRGWSFAMRINAGIDSSSGRRAMACSAAF